MIRPNLIQTQILRDRLRWEDILKSAEHISGPVELRSTHFARAVQPSAPKTMRCAMKRSLRSKMFWKEQLLRQLMSMCACRNREPTSRDGCTIWLRDSDSQLHCTIVLPTAYCRRWNIKNL